MAFRLQELILELRKATTEYSDARLEFASSDRKLKIFLVANLDKLLAKKRNAGVDTLYLLLEAENLPGVTELISSKELAYARYKGLEQVIEAIKEDIRIEKLLENLGG